MPALRCSTLLLATTLVWAIVACASDAGPSRVAYSVSDSAGVQLVRNEGDPAALDSSAVDLVESLRIGVVDGPDEYQFDGLRSIAVTEDGRIFAVNAGTQTIRVYDAEGRFLREFGGKGGGPDEFRSLSIVLIRGDTVVATAVDKVAVFDTLGTLLGTWTTRREMPVSASVGEMQGSARVFIAGYDSAGWLGGVMRYDYSIRYEIGRAYRDTTERFRIDVMTGRLSGEVVSRTPSPIVRYAVAEGGEGALVERLWEVRPSSARARDGRTYSSDGPAYVIDVRDPAGRLSMRITRAHRPVPLGEPEVHAFLDLQRAFHDTEPGRHLPGNVRWRKRMLELLPALGHPPQLQAIGRILPMPDSTLWVSRPDVNASPAQLAYQWSKGPGFRADPSQWDRFDASGRFLGSVRFPVDFSIRSIHASGILGVMRDSLDVEYIVKLRVPPAR